MVTGAGRGIGRAVAQTLASEGAKVVCASVTPANAERTAQEIAAATGQETLGVAVNVSVAAEVEALFAKVTETFGRVDVLVNNAGITRDTLLMRMSEEDWDAVLDTNLKGAFLCTKAVCRMMLRQKSGRIVNIASVVGLVGNAGQANYAASKGGLIALTKTTAKELGSRGITVNAVAPGFIETDMTEALSAELREQTKKAVPLGRLGLSEEVAKAVAFLASDDAAYITGQTLCVDGGLFM